MLKEGSQRVLVESWHSLLVKFFSSQLLHTDPDHLGQQISDVGKGLFVEHQLELIFHVFLALLLLVFEELYHDLVLVLHCVFLNDRRVTSREYTISEDSCSLERMFVYSDILVFMNPYNYFWGDAEELASTIPTYCSFNDSKWC